MAPSVATTVSRIGKVAHKFEYSCHRRPSRWHCYTNSSVSTTFLKKAFTLWEILHASFGFYLKRGVRAERPLKSVYLEPRPRSEEDAVR